MLIQDEEKVSLVIYGQADEKSDYLICLGEEETIVSGVDILEKKQIEFEIENSNIILPLVIKKYSTKNEDLMLKVDEIVLKTLF